MKISINKDSLLAVTQKMLGIVERNTTTPALSCILFRAEAGNRLIITATNREITSVIRRCAEVVKPGTALLPGKKLNELLRECQSEDITIETTRLNTTVTSGKSKFKLTTLSPDDFPVVEIPDNEDIQCLTLTGDDLKNLLGKVAYATANDNGTMTNMAGVFIEALPSNGKLVMVGTNGHRLSLVDANIPDATFAIPSGVTIPDKAVTEIKRLVDKAEKVFVGICKGDVVVKTDDAYLKLKTITASYPDYKRIIAPKTEISLTANRKDFLQAVRRVSVVSDNGKTDLSLSAPKAGSLLLPPASSTVKRRISLMLISTARRW